MTMDLKTRRMVTFHIVYIAVLIAGCIAVVGWPWR
jgi:DNA-binding transcriptional regulator of glucitol operon